jgi:hemerythrin-like domain-containing protein
MVRNNPDMLAQAGGEICSLAKALEEIFGAHLAMEENVIFPAARLLPEAERAGLLREMQERRKQ